MTGCRRREDRRNDDDDRVDLTDDRLRISQSHQLLSRVSVASWSIICCRYCLLLVVVVRLLFAVGRCRRCRRCLLLCSRLHLSSLFVSAGSKRVKRKYGMREYVDDGIRVNARICSSLRRLVFALSHSFIFHPPLPTRNYGRLYRMSLQNSWWCIRCSGSCRFSACNQHESFMLQYAPVCVRTSAFSYTSHTNSVTVAARRARVLFISTCT